MAFFIKTLLAAFTISFCSWLANRRPELAGFIISLPLTTILVLLFSYAEFQNPERSVTFAKSIFVGVPVSLLFFIPFLLADKFQLSFGVCFVAGLLALTGGFWLHQWIFQLLTRS